MAKFLLVVATIADLALAVLLVGVSGFMFGSGPESMHAGTLAAAGYVVVVIVCIASPIAGFVFNSRGKGALGLAAAWMPVAGALMALMIPAPY